MKEDGGNRLIKYADELIDGVSFELMSLTHRSLILSSQAAPNDGKAVPYKNIASHIIRNRVRIL